MSGGLRNTTPSGNTWGVRPCSRVINRPGASRAEQGIIMRSIWKVIALLAAAILLGAISTSDEARAQEVYAKAGVGFVPGAVVCRDFDTVSAMMEMISQHELQKRAAAVSPSYARDSQLLHGGIAPEPDLAAFGCVLVPPGGRMRLDHWGPIPQVTVPLEGGGSLSGVTSTAMVQLPK